MGDRATVAAREGVSDLLAQRERHKDLLVLLEEQGGAGGDGKGGDRRGLIGLSQVSGLEVLPGLQQQQQEQQQQQQPPYDHRQNPAKSSTMMMDDDISQGTDQGQGLGGVYAGAPGLGYSPPLALDPVARELRLLDKKAHTALKVGDPPSACCSIYPPSIIYPLIFTLSNICVIASYNRRVSSLLVTFLTSNAL